MFAYLKDHLPGAVYLNTETLRPVEGGIPTRLLDGRRYAALFARLAYPFDRPVVIYSAGETHNIDATFLAWLLRRVRTPSGLRTGRRLLQVAARAASGGAAVSAHSGDAAFPRAPSDRSQRRCEDAERAMRTARALLVDARPPEQYAGDAGAQMRHGHIPGAISHYWQGDLTQDGFGHVWKPTALS